MRLGIFAKTFVRPRIEAVFDAIRSHGLTCAQFNFACAGLEPMPERIDPALCDRIRDAARERSIELAAISGTFNMIHPDVAKRAEGIRRLRVLAEACPKLGIKVITLCTGTRDRENMWRGHPDNDSPDAWADLTRSMRAALRIAEEFGVTLGVEPEVSNVINSAAKARRLLDEMRSPRLTIVMDGANLFATGMLPRMREVLEEAFALLGRDIVLAHAKDVARDGEAGDLPAGKGKLDYDLYLSLLRRYGFDGPLISHGLKEAEVKDSVSFVRSKLDVGATPASPSSTGAGTQGDAGVAPTERHWPHDGIDFHYRDEGSGIPFVFQHGLGGMMRLAWGFAAPPPPRVRLISFDFRGHGDTRPLGDERKISIDTFADDVVALLDHLKIDKIVMGGISMGAAVALNFAVRYPERLRALVLSRPAWVDQPNPRNLDTCVVAARLIRQHPPDRARELFVQTPEYQALAAESEVSARGMLGQFDEPRALDAVVRLERIPADTPIRDVKVVRNIKVPTLVIACRPDAVHPFEYAEILAKEIPGAKFREVTSKFTDESRHTAEVKRTLDEFLETMKDER